MVPQDFAEQVAGVAALADPVRRRLFLYVAAQPGPVTRDQAAVSQLGDDTLHAKLDPAEGRCCVTITTNPG